LTTLFKYANGNFKVYLRVGWKYVKKRERYLAQC